MGKQPFYTDSEETEDTSSSMENVKKKKRFSILKCTSGNMRKKKCKRHSKSEPDDSDYRSRSRGRSRSRSRSSQRVKYKGILKTDRDYPSTDDEELEPPKVVRPQERCLVGRVPRPVGGKPGRGGGVAIIVKKNCGKIESAAANYLQLQESSTANSKWRMKKLSRKKSY